MYSIISIALLLLFTTIGYSQTPLSNQLRSKLLETTKKTADKEDLGDPYQVNLDLNGKNEIISFTGNDLFFLTRIYNHEMVEIHRSYAAYSTVLDLNNDGIPEVLEPNFSKEFLKQLDCKYCNESLSIGDYFEEVIFSLFNNPDYDKLIKEEIEPIFSAFAQDYNAMNPFNNASGLFLLTPIQILQYEDGKLIDKTTE